MKHDQYFYYRYSKQTGKLGRSGEHSASKGGFCIVAMVRLDNDWSQKIHWGFSKCLEMDNFSRTIGRDLAIENSKFIKLYSKNYDYPIIKEIANFLVEQNLKVIPFVNIDNWVTHNFGNV